MRSKLLGLNTNKNLQCLSFLKTHKRLLTQGQFKNVMLETFVLKKSCCGGGKVSLLRSRYQGRHATLLPTNGCSRERHIPFPLFLRTNRMHVIVIGYANLASRKLA